MYVYIYIYTGGEIRIRNLEFGISRVELLHRRGRRRDRRRRRVRSGILPAAVNLARKSISLTLIGPWLDGGDPRHAYRDSLLILYGAGRDEEEEEELFATRRQLDLSKI